MFSLSGPVLLMSVGTGNKMRDADLRKKGVKFLILASPVSLHSDNLVVEQAFNKFLELVELLENFRFKLQKINPREFAKIINQAHIVFVTTKRIWCQSPNIRENKL